MKPTTAVRLVLTGAVAALGYLTVVRPYQLHWGATLEEVHMPLPGDEIVERPWMNATRGVEIAAPPSAVWPWIVQMGGYTRAGWYSFDHVDNAGRPSATAIVPELQDLRVGDTMATGPDGQGFTVEAIDPARSLVTAIRRPDMLISSTFALLPTAAGTTRLLNRIRLRPLSRRTVPFALAMDTGDILFMARTLVGIRRRAEGALGGRGRAAA